MATLNFSLPEDLKAWITAQVAAGGYGNTSEYIRELVRLDRKRKSEDRLDALLLEGLEKLDAGKGERFEGPTSEALDAMMRSVKS